jgi:uncharacterized delta-60 repeat protein
MRTPVFIALIPVLIVPAISFSQPIPRDQRDQRLLHQHTLPVQTHKTESKLSQSRLADRDEQGAARISMEIRRQVNRTVSDSIHVAWVQHYGAGLAPAQDQATDLAVDQMGNVYVTGYSAGFPFGIDYFTAKYSPSGTLLWSVRYDGGGNDFAQAIAVDASGNIFVTGYSEATGALFDYATVKYNGAGVEQWVARYNGPGNSGDYAYDIAVDGSGDVYVTGYSARQNTSPYNYDYATIKYSTSGEQRWVARYNGPANDWDRAYYIAVDGSGNVYVAGHSAASGVPPYNFDYATVKYNNSGEQQWVSRYNGPANANDDPYDLAVDGAGNVVVTGYSGGPGSYFDYATVKYNNSGVQQWVVRYNGPGNSDDIARALALDDSGNVFVTGYSFGLGTAYDCTTIKYSASGMERWVARYNGPGNADDAGYAIGLDGSGNVYVTGQSSGSGTYYDYATVKYSTGGIEQWVVRYNGPGNFDDVAVALAVDGGGDVHVTGYSYGSASLGNDYATIKYNTSGAQEWVARYSGPGTSDDAARAIAVDVAGNVYVTGWSRGIGSDYATLKYSTNGSLEWSARYNGPGNSADVAVAIAIDAVGNVYVTGYSVGAGTANDYATVKYNAAGEQQWIARYNGPGNSEDYAYAIAVDASGNVYVTGDSRSAPTGNAYDYATVKYDASGNQLWVARYNGPANYDDRARAIAVDNSGNVFVTGYGRVAGITNDYITVKYNSAGQQQWVANYNGPGNGNDYTYALALDASGNVYVAGYSRGSGVDIQYDYATVKYNPAGQQQWAARYDGPANRNDYAEALAVDRAGSVFVTGWSWSGTSYDYATVKYSRAGVEQWVARYNGVENSDDVPSALVLDGYGNVYVTGRGAASSYYATMKYDSSGAERWVAKYYGPGNSKGDAYAVGLDLSGNVYVAGRTYSSDLPPSWSVFTTIKYQQEFHPLPAQVQLLSPANGAIVSDSVTFLWHRSQPEVDRYWFELSPDSTFAFTSVDSMLTDTTTVRRFTSGGQYWWRVKAHNAAGWGPFSAVRTFTVVIVGVEVAPQVPKVFALEQNYPNPFNPATRIKYSLPKESFVTLRVYNVLGQEIVTLVNQTQKPGYVTVAWDGRNSFGQSVGSGLYFYRFEARPTDGSDVFVRIRKAIVLR